MEIIVVKAEIFFQPEANLNSLWRRFAEATFFVHSAFDGRIFSLVLLPDRIEFLMQSEAQNKDFILFYFIELLFSEVQIYSHRLKQIEGLSSLYFEYRETYQRPVKMKLARRAELYPFSSLSVLIWQFEVECLICDPIAFQQADSCEVLEWLNQEMA